MQLQRMASLTATLVWLWPSTMVAQVYPIPFEAAAGLGVLGNHGLNRRQLLWARLVGTTTRTGGRYRSWRASCPPSPTLHPV